MTSPRSADPTLPCWCASTSHERCWRTEKFGLIRCLSCRTYRIDPPPMVDEYACERFYNEYYRSDRRPEPEAPSRFWRVVALEPSLLRVGASAVDIGCGDGHLCADLASRGWQTVVGLDVSRSRVARARKRYPHLRLLDAPIGSALIPTASVDLTVMDNVIEHLPNPLATVRELHRYLAPGGQVVIITPSMESGHFRLLGKRWTPELAPHAHIYLFTPSSLERLLAEAGLRVESIGSFHGPSMSISALLSRVIRGDVRGALWRAVQDAGALYGRLIGAGPMLYAVATPVQHGSAAAEATSTAGPVRAVAARR